MEWKLSVKRQQPADRLGEFCLANFSAVVFNSIETKTTRKRLGLCYAIIVVVIKQTS